MELTVGLDIGTSSVKCVAADVEGRVVASSGMPLSLRASAGGQVEQDGLEMWQAVVGACRQLRASLNGQFSLVGLSISSQGGTTIPVDERGEPTRLGFSWMDERAKNEALGVANRYGADRLYHTTGWRLSNGLPLNHIAWLHRYEPEVFSASRRFCFVNDFIQQRLCGEYLTDPSNAGISQLFSLAGKVWDPNLLEFAGVTAGQLSPIAESGRLAGRLTAQAAELTGFPAGMAVVNGAHDQYCAALGSGTNVPGKALLSAGTAWVLLGVFASAEKAFEAGMEVSRHALPNLFGGIRSMGGSGAAMEWLMGLLWPEKASREESWAALDEETQASSPGANGLLFAPLAGGHLESTFAHQGFLAGLELGHKRGDVARALMEGIGFELRWMLEEGKAGKWVDSLTMIGGAARNPIWPQVICDICGVPIRVEELTDAAALGAARLAALGIGIINEESLAERVGTGQDWKEPNERLRSTYDDLFARYQMLWQSRRMGMSEIG